jgi:menaquinone-dependent protoporphyrinogen oxidase
LKHDAVLVDSAKPDGAALAGADAVILAASVHQRRHPAAFETWVSASVEQLKPLKSLLISVSLSAAFPEGLEEARDYLTEMKMRTGFEPDAELLVAGAVRLDRYDYFATQVIRHVVLRGRKLDPDIKQHEFTDWTALKTGFHQFLES